MSRTDLVSIGDLDKEFPRLRIGVLVRVVFEGELVVGFLDLRRVRVLLKPEEVVAVVFSAVDGI